MKCLISPDIKSLATCSADKTIKLWTLAKDKGYVLSKTLYGNKQKKNKYILKYLKKTKDILNGYGIVHLVAILISYYQDHRMELLKFG